MWQYFHPGALKQYNDSLEDNARRILSRLLAGSAEEIKGTVR